MNHMDKIEKKYTNGEVTIVWKPRLCTHAAYCFTELPEVFDPSDRPWIKPGGAPTDKIIAQVKRCPTGALEYYFNQNKQENSMEENKNNEVKPIRVEIMENGPAVIKGKTLLVVNADGSEKVFDEITAVCRCSKSKNKPYCDGSHMAHKFE